MFDLSLYEVSSNRVQLWQFPYFLLILLFLAVLALFQPLMQCLFPLLKTVARYLHPHQHFNFHMRIQMFPTTNRHWNSRLIVQVGRCVLQLIQNPNLSQALALSIPSCSAIHNSEKIFRFKTTVASFWTKIVLRLFPDDESLKSTFFHNAFVFTCKI